MNQIDESCRIALAIKFKEYLLTRDVSSRRIVIEHFIGKITLPQDILFWFQNLKAINDQIDVKDRKEQIKSDAFWDDLILEHSKDSMFRYHMWFFCAS